MKYIYFDLETNGLFDKGKDLTIHCMSFAIDDEPVQRAVGIKAVRRELFKWVQMDGPKTLVAHNACGFDLVVLKQVAKFDWRQWSFQRLDTKVVGSLVDPEFSGTHSLEDWGQRVRAPKDNYQAECEAAGINPWAEYSERMGAYCDQDVVTLRAIHKYQVQKYLSTHNWETASKIEHGIAEVMAEQERNGCWFDIQAAHRLVDTMQAYIDERTERCKSILRPRCIPGEPVARVFKKDGKPSANAYKALGQADGDPQVVIGGEFSRVLFEDYDLDSRQQVINLLQQQGWKPTEYTETGRPKFTEDSITAQLGGIGKDLAERFVAITRLGQLRGWISKVRPDGRIAAKAFSQATPTARMRHSVVVNVPRPGTMWGPEMRSLFGAAPGCWQAGADASGLELRMLAHRINDPEFTKQVISGDIHWHICQLIGLVVKGTKRNKDTHTEEGKLHEAIRNVEKTWIYGLIYGAGDAKLGSILSDLPGSMGIELGNEAGGALTRDRFMATLPGYKQLMSRVEQYLKQKWMPGLDGRRLYIRHEHAALNTWLQSDGSIVVKLATTLAWHEIREKQIPARQILHFHDEAQYEGWNEGAAAAAGQAFVDGVKKAGLILKVNCPLDGEVKTGRNWAECH